MEFSEYSCAGFVDVLASKAPVPGGGGASALAGALGIALGNMVGSLTVGKKKYADVEDEIRALKEKADRLQEDLLKLMQKDADVFEPLSRAYSLPRETPQQQEEKARVMEAALKEASAVPLEIMEKCCEGITLIRSFAEKGSVMAVSDAGAAAALCRAALEAASLNVFINTRSMTDRGYAQSLNERADAMLERFGKEASEIYAGVCARLRD